MSKTLYGSKPKEAVKPSKPVNLAKKSSKTSPHSKPKAPVKPVGAVNLEGK